MVVIHKQSLPVASILELHDSITMITNVSSVDRSPLGLAFFSNVRCVRFALMVHAPFLCAHCAFINFEVFVVLRHSSHWTSKKTLRVRRAAPRNGFEPPSPPSADSQFAFGSWDKFEVENGMARSNMFVGSVEFPWTTSFQNQKQKQLMSLNWPLDFPPTRFPSSLPKTQNNPW